MTAHKSLFEKINAAMRGEILTQSQSLLIYGALLSLTNTLTYFFWAGSAIPFVDSPRGSFVNYIKASGPGMCPPSLLTCGWLRFVPTHFVTFTLGIYFLTSMAVAILFLTPSTARIAYFGLLAEFIFKYALLFSNSLLTGNYHYVVFFVTLVYLFFPQKLLLLRFTFVLFYLSAGLLKLNPEWMSAQALLRPAPAWLTPTAIHLAMTMAPVFELIISFCLLFKNYRFRWTAYLFLLAFHAISLQQINYFLPCLMFMMTLVFPLSWLSRDLNGQESAIGLLVRGAVPYSHIILLCLILAAQIYPRFLPGSTALTGQARFLALNMFDSTPTCYNQLLVHQGKNSIVESQTDLHLVPVRIRCDPLRFLNIALKVCQRYRDVGQEADLDSSVIVKRSSDSGFIQTTKLADVCSKPPTYSSFSNNPWITQ